MNHSSLVGVGAQLINLNVMIEVYNIDMVSEL
jgi:hypothetical protein